MALITDLPSTTAVASADLFVKDTGAVTQKIAASDLAAALGGGVGLLSSNPDLIYNGGKAATGTITISSAYTNYKWFLIIYITNVDRCTQFVPTSAFSSTSSSIICTSSGGNWVSSTDTFQYESACQLKRNNTTTFSVSSTYRDVNWVLGVEQIYGFK